MAQETDSPTTVDITRHLRALARNSYAVARARGLIDGTSNTGEELALIARDALLALDRYKAGDAEGLALELSNVVLRSLTLSEHRGIDLGSRTVARAVENAKRVRR